MLSRAASRLIQHTGAGARGSRGRTATNGSGSETRSRWQPRVTPRRGSNNSRMGPHSRTAGRPGRRRGSDGGRESGRAQRGWAGGKARAGSSPRLGTAWRGGREEKIPGAGRGRRCGDRSGTRRGSPTAQPGPTDTHRDSAAGPNAAPITPRPARAHRARSRDPPAPSPPRGSAPRSTPGAVVRGARREL